MWILRNAILEIKEITIVWNLQARHRSGFVMSCWFSGWSVCEVNTCSWKTNHAIELRCVNPSLSLINYSQLLRLKLKLKFSVRVIGWISSPVYPQGARLQFSVNLGNTLYHFVRTWCVAVRWRVSGMSMMLCVVLGVVERLDSMVWRDCDKGQRGMNMIVVSVMRIKIRMNLRRRSGYVSGPQI